MTPPGPACCTGSPLAQKTQRVVAREKGLGGEATPAGTTVALSPPGWHTVDRPSCRRTWWWATSPAAWRSRRGYDAACCARRRPRGGGGRCPRRCWHRRTATAEGGHDRPANVPRNPPVAYARCSGRVAPPLSLPAPLSPPQRCHSRGDERPRGGGEGAASAAIGTAAQPPPGADTTARPTCHATRRWPTCVVVAGSRRRWRCPRRCRHRRPLLWEGFYKEEEVKYASGPSPPPQRPPMIGSREGGGRAGGRRG